ncbi:hypothetical protein [Chitinophaga rhizosphaerae]|uniref:hypothetical protein n=1 Tax=Chitinophaga rhizosphaerae TaxID=1864947 RepID=UPI000F803DCE|nr:hypothetical protein [Chitinophaga rhizosphaerae]
MRQAVEHLESIFNEICTNSLPYEWDEDHISYQLMQKLRQLFSNKIIRFDGWSKIVNWQSFKNRGRQENRLGDIALLITIQFSSGEILKGVACLEAKRDFNSNSFESMNIDQLNRIWSGAPYSHLLLYTNTNGQELPLKFPDERTWRSHIWVSPINTAKELLKQTKPKDNRNVLRISFPFSMFLTSRIFWGLDLDYREEIFEDIVKGINKIANPSYLGVVNVYYRDQQPIEISLSDVWESI